VEAATTVIAIQPTTVERRQIDNHHMRFCNDLVWLHTHPPCGVTTPELSDTADRFT
jgi:hypothetical protein